ncbi:hypothetical protein P153DRAFT_433875 [Dothidotthia symphoricarpi CBS 119687]|uniref:Uncharacterized protein n=1 Tax=Dothidotthia symphoricarpi CBS 119687 TaxID=1392245 RepID=A0A6A6A3E6_9PLEO|nr:uncharacterized protein P153DRAFT_433875 [Dothidotthia symphoricarpi CBS 119687]KAF2126076.1 hypothetical protein P153DRAFT_433875 [Dothidotthia symphoricarpi CBS 119687]
MDPWDGQVANSMTSSEADAETSLPSTTLTTPPPTEARELFTASESSKPSRPQTTRIPYALSSQSSETIVGDEYNAAITESSWSGTTYTEDNQVRSVSLLDNELVTRSRPGSENIISTPDLPVVAGLKTSLSTNNAPSSASPILGSLPTRQRSTNIPKFGTSRDTVRHRKLQDLTKHNQLERGSAPWSVYNLRTPGTVCAFCAVTFTGPLHKEDAIRHTRDLHLSHRKNQTSNPKQFAMTETYDIDMVAPGSIIAECNLSTRMSANRKDLRLSVSQPRLVPCDNRAIPEKQLLFLLDTLDPQACMGRANDFFNGLDTIVGNLLERCPGDVAVQGMQRALARLDQLYRLNFGTPSSSDQWSTATEISYSSTRSPSGDNRATSLSYTGGTGSAGGLNDCPDEPVKSIPNGQEQLVPNAPLNDLDNGSKRTKAKCKNRPLGCPIKKHYVIHNQVSSCNFTGAANMWGVAKHLKSLAHIHSLPFLALCRNCWKYTKSEVAYQEDHRPGRCQHAGQPRGPRVEKYWCDLYIEIYPTLERIPRPFVDDMTWRPAASMRNTDTIAVRDNDDLELNFNSAPEFQSFLEFEPTHLPDELPMAFTVPNQTHLVTIEAAEAAAIELYSQMFLEHVHQPFDINDHHMRRLMDHADETDVNAFSNAFRTRLHQLIQSSRQQQLEGVIPDLILPPAPEIFTSHALGDHDRWLEQFPVPEEMINATPPYQFLPDEQLSVDHGPYQDIESLDFLYTGLTFDPESDFPPTQYPMGPISLDGTQTTISV